MNEDTEEGRGSLGFFCPGSYTCIVFLTDHPGRDDHGTGFFRHIETGWTRMPTWEWLNEAENKKCFDLLKKDCHEYVDGVWEQVGYVPGKKNRAIIFDSPIFHCRSPMTGIGSTPEDGRMIWVCHFAVEEDSLKTSVGGG